MTINIRNYNPEDWKQVSKIYRQGIKTKNATFEVNVPPKNEWEAKQIPGCTLIAEIENEIVGWASITFVSARKVYKGVGEVSVYISLSHTGKGVGKLMLEKLIKAADKHNVWTLQASIFPENSPSIKLHLSCGFREIGYREKIGKMDGVWRDTLLLERRSKTLF